MKAAAAAAVGPVARPAPAEIEIELSPGDPGAVISPQLYGHSAAYLALAYQSQGKFAQSEPLAREAVEFERKKRPDHWQRFLWGASLAGQKKYAEAEPLMLAGYQGMAARKTGSQSRAVITWTAPAQASPGSTLIGANQTRPRSGRRRTLLPNAAHAQTVIALAL